MLLERGRHAGYLVLTGPDGRQHTEPGETEPVILTKRKIKEDVSESAALRVGADESAAGEAEVKEAFYRLRFSDALFWNTNLHPKGHTGQRKPQRLHVELDVHSSKPEQLSCLDYFIYISVNQIYLDLV